MTKFYVGLIAVLLSATKLACVADENITLVSNGEPQSVIVVGAKPLVGGLTPENPLMQDGRINSRIFAEDFQYWIKRATGAEIPIVDEDNVPDGKTLILFGESKLTKKYGFDCRNMKPEEFQIKTFDKGVALLGDVFPAEDRGGYYCNKMGGEYPNPAPGKGDFIDRSIGHATYEFLEKFLGYRFYLGADRKNEDDIKFGTITPELKDIVIPAGTSFSKAPSFQHRQDVVASERHPDPLSWYRCFRFGWTADVHANHTHIRWHIAYGDTYPEIFARQKDGTPYFKDASLNPDHASGLNYAHPKVLELEIKHIEHWDKHHTHLPTGWRWFATPNRLVPTPADGQWYDYSEEAKPLSNPDGDLYESQTDVYWKYIEKLALVAKERWPERMVVGAAYNRRMYPPTDKVNLPDNVACQLSLCRSSALTTQKPHWDWMDELVTRWWEILGRDRMRLGTWDYLCWPHGFYPAPVVNPFHLQKFLRHFHPKIAGQIVNDGGKPKLNHIMIIVWHKLLWDKDADVAAIIREHCELFYGPAGSHVERLYRLTADRYENVQWAKHFNPTTIPPDAFFEKIYPENVVAEMRDCFKEAYAALEDPKYSLYKKRLDNIYCDAGLGTSRSKNWVNDYWMVDGWEAFFRISDAYHRTAKPQTIVVSDKIDNQPIELPLSDHIVTARKAPSDMRTTFTAKRSGGNIVFSVTTKTPPENKVHSDMLTFTFYDVPRAGDFKPELDQHEEFLHEGAAAKQNALPIMVASNGKVNAKGVNVRKSSADGATVFEVEVPLSVLGFDASKKGVILFNFTREVNYKDFALDSHGRNRGRRFDVWALALRQSLPWQSFDVKKRACRLSLE